MRRTRIKVCGITSPADGRMAAEAGVDAVGLVFYPGSRRAVTPEEGAEILAGLPPFVTAVGLFVDPEPEAVDAVLATCPLDLLQFHGEEAPQLCQSFGRRYIKALRMGREADVGQAGQRFGLDRLLLDAYVAGEAGGTGRSFRWERIPADMAGSITLAGGLSPDNIAEAVRTVRPWAVDVSTGVESEPGVKSPERVRAFVQGVLDADNR